MRDTWVPGPVGVCELIVQVESPRSEVGVKTSESVVRWVDDSVRVPVGLTPEVVIWVET